MELENNIKLCHRSTLMNQAVEELVDVDITLPDYCPDIEKILKCSLTPQIYSRNISGGVLEIEGASIVKIMYVDSICKTLRTSQQLVPFTKAINMKEYTEGHYLETKATTEYVNCRALSPRRLVVKGAFSIKAELVAKEANIVPSATSFSNFQRKSCKKKYLDVTAVTEETFNINETISVENKPTIESVVKTIVKVSITDHKSIDDKIMLKGEVNLRMLYLSDIEKGETECIDYLLPFNQIISCVGADDNTINNIICSLLSYDVKTSKDTEDKSVMLEARINASVVCYKERESGFITDAYSRDYSCDIKNKSVQMVNSVREIKRNFIRKMDISSNDKEFSKIIDAYNETSSVSSSDEGGNITFTGKAGLCVLACDKDNVPFYIERTMDFTDKTDETFGNVISPNVTVTSVSYRIKDEHTIELRVEFNLSAFVLNSESCLFVEDIIVYEDKKVEKNNSALTLYFAEEGESLWDIAKRYFTDEIYIKEDNELDSDILPEKEMLIIRR